MLTPDPSSRRFVGDPVVSNDFDRMACLYGAAMMRKVGRLPNDMSAIDVHFKPPSTLVFISADGRQVELGRYVIPDRVLTYDPRPIALPPDGGSIVMSWLIWVQGLRAPTPQKVFGSDAAPFIDEGVRGCVLAQHKLSAEEEGLSLAELMTRYPAPEHQVEAS